MHLEGHQPWVLAPSDEGDAQQAVGDVDLEGLGQRRPRTRDREDVVVGEDAAALRVDVVGPGTGPLGRGVVLREVQSDAVTTVLHVPAVVHLVAWCAVPALVRKTAIGTSPGVVAPRRTGPQLATWAAPRPASSGFVRLSDEKPPTAGPPTLILSTTSHVGAAAAVGGSSSVPSSSAGRRRLRRRRTMVSLVAGRLQAFVRVPALDGPHMKRRRWGRPRAPEGRTTYERSLADRPVNVTHESLRRALRHRRHAAYGAVPDRRHGGADVGSREG